MVCRQFCLVFCRRPHLLLKYKIAVMLKLRHRLRLMSFELMALDKYASELCFCCTTLMHWLGRLHRLAFNAVYHFGPGSAVIWICQARILY